MRIPLITVALSLWTLFFLPSTYLSSQNTAVIDSLISEVPRHDDSTQVFLFVDICLEFCKSDPQAGQKYAEQALQIAERIFNRVGIGRSKWALGYCHHLLGEYQQAETYHLKALEALKGQHIGSYERAVYSELAQIYSSQGAYQKSLKYYEEGLKICQKLGNDRMIATFVFGMANSYSALGNFSKAFELLNESKPLIKHRPHLIYYYAILGELYGKSGSPNKGLEALYKSSELCIEFTDTMRLAYIYEAIGAMQTELGNYEEAANYFFRVIKLNEDLDIPSLELICHLGLGKLFRLWEEKEKSFQYFRSALSLAEEHQLNSQISEAHLGLGLLLMEQQKHINAKGHFEKALALAKEMNAPNDVINCYLNLSDIHLIMHEYSRALLVLSEAIKFIPDEKDLQAHFYFSVLSKKGEVYLKKANYTKCIVTLKDALKYSDGEEDEIELQENYKNLSLAFEKTGDFKSALKYYQQFARLKEQMEKKLNSKEIAEMRTRFETEEKQKEVELLEHKTEIQSLNLLNKETELERKESHVLLLGLLLFLAIGLFWSLFSRFKWRKESEQLRLKKMQVELEKKHLETNQQLEFAELRSKVFTNISHEFRTSLTLILSPLESILSGFEKSSRATHRMMHRNAKKLLDLVNETLDLAKLESGHMPLALEKCDIDIFLKEIAMNFSPLAEVKNISLHIIQKNKNRFISIDKTKFEKVISNLLSNAFEHSPAGSDIFVTCRDKDNSKLEIEIMDQGEGIPMEHQQYIFDRFYQVDKNSNRGTGIGLALVKEIIELHQGEIQVRSKKGMGATFSILIPVEQKNLQIPHSVKLNDHPLSDNLQLLQNELSKNSGEIKNEKITDLKILVVEDNPDVQNYLAESLAKNARVLTASDGKEGLAMAREISPDLIVCDVMMPKMQGFDLTKILKSDLQTSHIPIILLTAKASKESTITGLRAGADDYLTKPFNMEELELRVYNIIQQRRKLQELFSAKREIPIKKIALNKLDEEFLERALSIVKNRLGDAQFNVERFAQHMGMSRTNLFTKLKSLTGKNIAGFIRTLRIHRAVELIKTNSGNMNEIAFSVGFNNRQSFIKSFKLEMGKTPSQFKKTLGLMRTQH